MVVIIDRPSAEGVSTGVYGALLTDVIGDRLNVGGGGDGCGGGGVAGGTGPDGCV